LLKLLLFLLLFKPLAPDKIPLLVTGGIRSRGMVRRFIVIDIYACSLPLGACW
jgi:hypothetical protein